jgi:GT2 family glycosyltransferase
MVTAPVIALVVTHRRAALLGRLLDSLAARVGEGLGGVVVVDNGGDPTTADVLQNRPEVVAHLLQHSNPGYGIAMRRGIEWALANTAASHLLITDDDTVWPAGSIAAVLAAARAASAGLVVPLITDAAGEIGYFPGLVDRAAFRVIRQKHLTPAAFIAACGEEPRAFTWAPGCAWLVARAAVEAVGLPREDFGFMAEDLEYALRISHRFPALLAPRAVMAHLPPKVKRGPEGAAVAALHLQNLAYLTCRLPHGRRSLRHLPGGVWRYLCSQGSVRLPEALRLLWVGAVLGRPGGVPGADRHWRDLRRVLDAT